MRLPDCEFRLATGKVIVSCSHPDTPTAVTRNDCANCQLINRPIRCCHSQGQVDRTVQVECCGGKINDVPVYKCDVHGNCAGDKTAWNRLRSVGVRVKACHNCTDFCISDNQPENSK